MPVPRSPKWTTSVGAFTAGAVLLAVTSPAPVGRVDQAKPLVGSIAAAQGHQETPQPPRPPENVDTVVTDFDEPVPITDSGSVIPAVFAGPVPAKVLDAYRAAAERIAKDQPGCHLPMDLLAAIGKVETNHAGQGQVDANGTTRTPILGPPLNGVAFARIADTDGGRLDGDTTWDRAVGPMQFIPTTWATWASDGNGDRRADPNNVYDASLAAGRYLCADNRDLATPEGLGQAIFSYNRSTSYGNLVRGWMFAYANGAAVVSDAVIPVGYVPDNTPKVPTVIAAVSPPAVQPVAAPAVIAAPAVVEAPPTETPPAAVPPSATAPTAAVTPTTEPSTSPPTSTATPPTSTSPSPEPPAEAPTVTATAVDIEPVMDMVCDTTEMVDGLVTSIVDTDTGDRPAEHLKQHCP